MPTYQIFFIVGGADIRVVVDGQDLHIIEQVDERLLANPPGFSDGLGRFFPDHPTFEDCKDVDAATGKCASYPGIPVAPEDFIATLADQPLQHLRTPAQGQSWSLTGYFARVDDCAGDCNNAVTTNWHETSPTFKLASDYFTLRIDSSIADNDDFLNPSTSLPDECNAFYSSLHREVCPKDTNATPTPTPVATNCPIPFPAVAAAIAPQDGDLLTDNLLWEQRFDQLSDYAYVDQAAENFHTRHGHVLRPSVNGDPTLEVKVHIGPSGGGFYPGPNGKADHIGVASNTCWRLLSGGNNRQLTPSQPQWDFYSWSNPGRDRGSMWHEFTHAIVWDLTQLDSKGFGAPFNEGVADFFSASVLTENGDLSPWRLGGRQLDPFLATGGSEIDFAYPGSFLGTSPALSPTESHDEGFPWSSFLWDLRKRGQLLKASFTNTTLDEHAVEDLEFEALTRTPKTLADLNPTADFQEGPADALQRLLDADARLTGKQLSYDILSAAARHGIKLDPYIAAVEPDRYNYQQGDPLITFRVFTGANPNYVLTLSTDPVAVMAPSQSQAKVFTFTCLAADGCSAHPIPSDVGKSQANLTDTVTLTKADLDPLFADATGPMPLYYLLTTSTSPDPENGPCFGPFACHLRVLDIPGAGFTFAEPDLPAVILLPTGFGPTCRCDMTSGEHGLKASLLIFVLAAVFAVRQRRVCA